MKPLSVYVFFSVFCLFSGLVNSFAPLLFFGGSALMGLFGGAVYDYQTNERCNSGWIHFNPRGLQDSLNTKLFGQHLASPLIYKAVSGFLISPSSQKPLVLSLHGTTGTGKNFVSKMIANNLYLKGMDSKFVHLFTATKHFPHSHRLEKDKVWLRDYIEASVDACDRSLFIFDEVDKMNPGLMDVIQPYLEFHHQLDRVSYRNAIFIFLSNAGGEKISRTALDFKEKGRRRSSILLRHLEEDISLDAFNSNSGFSRTSLLERSLVDFFVPFLPLEFDHVVQCVLSEMRSRNLAPREDVAQKLAGDLIYFPKVEQAFSSNGCKAIEKKLPFYL